MLQGRYLIQNSAMCKLKKKLLQSVGPVSTYYLLGKNFHIETDHKPLVPLLSHKQLDMMPIRIQRFRMRMMQFSYSVSHVPGKDLVIADTLSRAPVGVSSKQDQELADEVAAYVTQVVSSLPATKDRLHEIRDSQSRDEICQKVLQYVKNGWPRHVDAAEEKKFVLVQGELNVQNGLLLCGNRIVIPKELRKTMLKRIHTGHQGITKCRERARQSIWWPRISSDIEEMVTKCVICSSFRSSSSEPLIPTKFPQYPWQKLGSD